ncbi:MAG: LAGLIDADG family homing endonuclease, partial [Halobacteriales archaeon]
NNVISHNSQLLQYIRNIAPRSIYTSGKGSSSAGLTAAAVKDDFGDGQQWSLEAGALVLADMGIAAVDELDKMRCVTGDTLVHLDDEIVPIRDLAIRAEQDGAIEEHGHGRTIRGLDESVYTMTEDGRIVSRGIQALHEYEAPEELVEVTLESGEKLTTTADHPFFVLDDGERDEQPAAGLAEGDWVYVPQNIPTAATDGGAVTQPISDWPVPNEHVTPDHGAILGYLAGDGNVIYDRAEGVYGIRFTNKESELIEDFNSACGRAFDDQPTLYPSDRRDDGVDTATLRGKAVVDELFDIGAGLGRYDRKTLPGGITGASRAAKAAFIRGFADSDGSVDVQTGNVKLGSTSYRLLLGIKELLLEFGISSQIQFRPRSDRRDYHILAITSKASVDAYREQIGFTLTRKQQALEAVCQQLSGDRTIIDVLPDCGELFQQARTDLRLYQRECGINDATYCNFEKGVANASFTGGESILTRFEERTRQASTDAAALAESCSWDRLDEFRQRYHVSQEELASQLTVNQQAISAKWGEDPELRERVRRVLQEIVQGVEEVNLEPLRELIRGDVKWRRVSNVEVVERDEFDDDRVPILKHRLADLLEMTNEEAAFRTARGLLQTPQSASSWEELRQCLERHAVSFQQIADTLEVSNATISRWFTGRVDVGNFEQVRTACFDVLRSKRSELRSLVNEIDDRNQPNVYDLTVEGTHNYVANGMVVHNSEDRSALHEALEQQQISISKAGINATLKSRCALLGAANPKYGRFDQYEPIAEQIDLEPALISRFDLIFTVTDAPDEERDAELADHILRTNYAGELQTQKDELASPTVTDDDVESAAAEVVPAIEPELFRKYIAYAKRNVFPSMTDEARQAIRDFYVDLRARGTEADAPVPITARKLEALVRLAEASARVRLSDTVDEQDAERVISIVRGSLKDIGVDPETGQFDADVIETGTSKSQRDRIKSLRALISEIETEYEEGAPIEEVKSRAAEAGIDESKVDHEIEKLRQRGEVYEPATGHLRTT